MRCPYCDGFSIKERKLYNLPLHQCANCGHFFGPAHDHTKKLLEIEREVDAAFARLFS